MNITALINLIYFLYLSIEGYKNLSLIIQHSDNFNHLNSGRLKVLYFDVFGIWGSRIRIVTAFNIWLSSMDLNRAQVQHSDSVTKLSHYEAFACLNYFVYALQENTIWLEWYAVLFFWYLDPGMLVFTNKTLMMVF